MCSEDSDSLWVLLQEVVMMIKEMVWEVDDLFYDSFLQQYN